MGVAIYSGIAIFVVRRPFALLTQRDSGSPVKFVEYEGVFCAIVARS